MLVFIFFTFFFLKNAVKMGSWMVGSFIVRSKAPKMSLIFAFPPQSLSCLLIVLQVAALKLHKGISTKFLFVFSMTGITE